MSRRQEKIVNFFSGLLANTEEVNYDEVVKESLALFDEITHVMKNGTDEEKKEIMNAMETINKQVTEQFDVLCEEFGISKEEVKRLINDPNNFSKDIWGAMESLSEGLKITEDKEDKKLRKPKHKKAQWVSA